MRFIASLFVACSALTGCLITMPATAQIVPSTVADRAPLPSMTDKENLLYLDLSTGGRVVIWLRPDVAPKTVERIKILARRHFYDGLIFHRVIDGFMAQTGDPKGDGTGGSELPDLKAEFNYLPHVRGAVSAARAQSDDSANSQFFIVFQPTLKLDKKYTVFGRVIEGMDYVDAVERGEPPAAPSKIVHAYVAADSPPGFTPAAAAPAADLGPAVTLPMSTPAKPAAKPSAPGKKKSLR
ncbi:peptidylprolyl isomerase [Sphingomonas sp. 28-63-12]|uniref:peptidylprolyl isomerase n=1 Tax=Sphingomonas sp. 28-63-12 TaxID=1970434 RepID=UPI000BDB4FB7|nr:MAG: peptidylprolyl isomerase [Sphingomonas sp. 28-63-12]